MSVRSALRKRNKTLKTHFKDDRIFKVKEESHVTCSSFEARSKETWSRIYTKFSVDSRLDVEAAASDQPETKSILKIFLSEDEDFNVKINL